MWFSAEWVIIDLWNKKEKKLVIAIWKKINQFMKQNKTITLITQQYLGIN